MGIRAVILAAIALAVGCGADHKASPQTVIEASALQLIEYEKLSPELERLLDLAIRDRLVGQPAGDHSDLLALADKTEQHGQFARYEFWLPLSRKAKQSMYDDQLVHYPAIWIEVDRNAERIRRCRVYEIRF